MYLDLILNNNKIFLVWVVLDVCALAGLCRLALASVLTELSQRVSLGPNQESILGSLYILGSSSPCLQASVLEGSGVGKGYVPWVWALVHGIQIQGCLHFRLSTRQKLYTKWLNNQNIVLRYDLATIKNHNNLTQTAHQT